MMSLYDFLRAGHVKRWHIVNTTCQQSIAEHSYLVAIMAMHIHESILPDDSMSEMMATGIYALFHDAVEIRTGDIPTPAKRLLREADGGEAGEPDIFERLDHMLMPRCPIINEPNDFNMQCVRMADAIEAAHWIRENGAGRHAEIVAAGCWRRVEDLVAKFDAKPYDWYRPVNEVLMALGMPYISREERISPP